MDILHFFSNIIAPNLNEWPQCHGLSHNEYEPPSLPDGWEWVQHPDDNEYAMLNHVHTGRLFNVIEWMDIINRPKVNSDGSITIKTPAEKMHVDATIMCSSDPSDAGTFKSNVTVYNREEILSDLIKNLNTWPTSSDIKNSSPPIAYLGWRWLILKGNDEPFIIDQAGNQTINQRDWLDAKSLNRDDIINVLTKVLDAWPMRDGDAPLVGVKGWRWLQLPDKRWIFESDSESITEVDWLENKTTVAIKLPGEIESTDVKATITTQPGKDINDRDTMIEWLRENLTSWPSALAGKPGLPDGWAWKDNACDHKGNAICIHKDSGEYIFKENWMPVEFTGVINNCGDELSGEYEFSVVGHRHSSPTKYENDEVYRIKQTDLTRDQALQVLVDELEEWPNGILNNSFDCIGWFWQQCVTLETPDQPCAIFTNGYHNISQQDWFKAKNESTIASRNEVIEWLCGNLPLSDWPVIGEPMPSGLPHGWIWCAHYDVGELFCACGNDRIYKSDIDKCFDEIAKNIFSNLELPKRNKPAPDNIKLEPKINLNKQYGKMHNPIMQYFEYKHLPEYLHRVGKEFLDIAHYMNDGFPPSEEKAVGLRKLLEAKDCFIRVATKPYNMEIKHTPTNNPTAIADDMKAVGDAMRAQTSTGMETDDND